jgi:hypothetical protein
MASDTGWPAAEYTGDWISDLPATVAITTLSNAQPIPDHQRAWCAGTSEELSLDPPMGIGE